MSLVEIVKNIEGYDKLYDHQEKSIEKIDNDKGVLLVAPTAAGKTVVAKAALLNAIKNKKRAIYTSPLVALSSEKYEEFQEFFSRAKDLGIIENEPNIVFLTGEIHEATQEKGIKNADILVTSFEKFDSIITKSEAKDFIKSIGTIVIDEIHVLYDESRGATVEKFVSIIKHINPDVKFVALSATVGNPELIAQWLSADLVKTDFRPVKLQKLVYAHKDEILVDTENTDNIVKDKSYYKLPINFIKEKLRLGKQIIIFVSSRRIAESLAKNLSTITNEYVDITTISEKIDFSKLENDPISERVSKMLAKGISFHHSGLPSSTRRIIENAFREGIIKIIVATPGLSAGVNLPANTVIVRDITRYDGEKSTYLSAFEVQQMIGRAGRPQYDKEGTAVIVTNIQDSIGKVANKYYYSGIEPVNSSIARDFKKKYNILETKLAHLVLQFAKILETTSTDAIKNAFKNTFAYVTDPWIFDAIDNTLEELKNRDFINDAGASILGEISLRSYVLPETVLHIRDHLHESMSEEEFIFMLVTTPEARNFGNFNVSGDIDIDTVFEIAERIGADPFEDTDDIVKTMMILDWINGKSDADIFEKYGVLPGDFRGYITTLEWMAWTALNVASALEIDTGYSEDILLRIRYGIPEEAVDLVRLPMIGKVRAMRLYNAGIRNIQQFIETDSIELSKITGLRPETIDKLKSHF